MRTPEELRYLNSMIAVHGPQEGESVGMNNDQIRCLMDEVKACGTTSVDPMQFCRDLQSALLNILQEMIHSNGA